MVFYHRDWSPARCWPLWGCATKEGPARFLAATGVGHFRQIDSRYSLTLLGPLTSDATTGRRSKLHLPCISMPIQQDSSIDDTKPTRSLSGSFLPALYQLRQCHFDIIIHELLNFALCVLYSISVVGHLKRYAPSDDIEPGCVFRRSGPW